MNAEQSYKSSLLVSVVLPMTDHRGMAEEAVTSWTALQKCAPDCYEIIVLLDQQTKSLEALIRPLLREHDVCCLIDAANEMEMYDLGARTANGDILFFTEPHCLADQFAIANTIARLYGTDEKGFCCRSTPLVTNDISRFESAMFDSGFENWSQPGAWQKVILRGFVLRRDVYLQLGGFAWRYDRFAEWLLAAELSRKGINLGYAKDVVVSHLYADSFRLLDTFIEEFTVGECLFRIECNDPVFCNEFFGRPDEWSDFLSWDPVKQRESLTALLRIALCLDAPSLALRIAALLYIFLSLPQRVLGVKWSWLKCQFSVRITKLMVRLPFLKQEVRKKAFANYWQRTTKLSRIRYLLQNRQTIEGKRIKDTVPTLSNISAAEVLEGTRFCWTRSMFGFFFNVGRPGFRLTVEMLPMARKWNLQRICLVNASGLLFTPKLELSEQRALVHFQIPESMARVGALFLFCPQPRRWLTRFLCADQRDLGLPVISMYIDQEMIWGQQ